MPYEIGKIAHIIGARRLGDSTQQITWLLTDSRSLTTNPEQTLFFALQTARNNGARFIPQLYDRGVRNFVLNEEGLSKLDTALLKDANLLVVNHPLQALQTLAEHHRRRFQCPVVGITGSNGKTVAKEWLYQLLSKGGHKVVRSPRSYNSQVGVPLSVWGLDEDTEVGIFEAGISKPGEMDALADIIKPTIGVLTNIGGAHQENFTNMRQKCLEKLKLFRESDVIIFNADDELINSCVQETILPTRQMAWSRKDPEALLYINEIVKGEQSTKVRFTYLHDFMAGFNLPFIDDASIENSLHCLAVYLFLLREIPEGLLKGLETLEPVAMRLEVKEGKDGCLLINDSYNSDLGSLDIALDFLGRRSESHQLKRTLILSDMLETGWSSSTLYKKVAKLAETYAVERMVGVGHEISKAASCFEKIKESQFYENTAELLDAINHHQLELRNEIILIKGARKFGFDALTELLEKKVHETILEVNLGAMIANLNHYRSFLKPETKMVCMVKASAYGAGSYEVAKTLQEHRVDYLAVAVADEGSELRKAGITANILIMNPELTAFKTMFDYHLEPEVYSFHLLDELVKAAEKEGVTNFPIHIKLDTGMHRLGFLPDEIPTLITRLKAQNAVMPRSVFSHFVGSDSPQFDAFTHHQIAVFDKASNELQAAFPHKILRHICNTAGIERFPEAQYDMVRLGLGLYGINPINNGTLHNISTLKTTILQIHEVPADETVGYSRRGELKRTSRIAAIPIGYADGLNRHLGRGNAYCLVNGQKAKYVGNICMDVCMIDVTDIDCKEGDQVEIFGDHLPVHVLSDALDTIPYEVLTGISNRVKRVYYQD
ncbi:MAG: bifunctional UDP-N-acetylmuramoyl-tripeptide:D-alanyl-D-alanine ligase/alanine racemase [Bacteroidaceae bacterium]|nr:bifunctional UDP-N-acetylmuramoyl-tripeptide:D-alanyl-D-alanine ligase/alanine racemase [Bacteroidaceae bacterium]